MTSEATKTLLPFCRLEPDGSETCFWVEYSGSLDLAQTQKVNKALAPFFRYLPSHRVTTTSVMYDRFGTVGPRLAIETPFSSSAVEIFRACGIPEVTRVEAFRHYQVPAAASNVADCLTGCYDPVTECVYSGSPQTFAIDVEVAPVQTVPLFEEGREALQQFCDRENLGFNALQLEHIERIFLSLGKNPTDVALFQLAQMWSDHCRHLLFNAKLTIDGTLLPYTLFDLLRSPYRSIKGGPTDNVVIGFFDNASAIVGTEVLLLVPANPGSPGPYVLQSVKLHHILSGETHNYPAHVSPYHGCATEIGGEIRDQLGVGCGSDLLYAGCGRVVGSLWFPGGYQIPGEIVASRAEQYVYPVDKATPLKIVLDGLAGWHFYANCFGKPCIYGFFYSGAVWRPFINIDGDIFYERIESLKPVCYGVSGGTVREEHLQKTLPIAGMKIVQIGGPAFPIGFCGGSGSSSISGSNVAAFDENAVQRGNPEMERRFYQVLLACIAMGKQSPIVTIHDQGAGGISNVLTELIEKCGGRLYIGAVRRGDPTMPDVKVWVCEYQERQGLVVPEDRLTELLALCQRENCPCEVLGEVTGDGRLLVYSEASAAEAEAKAAEPIIELNLAQVLQDMPPIELSDDTPKDVRVPLRLPDNLTLESALAKVLRRSEVGSKAWAIRTVDGSVGGNVICNQRCGPFGLPVNDCGLVALSHETVAGQAASLGVAPYKTVLCPPAGGRMAIGEMITNLMGVVVEDFAAIQCICNWMWPANLKPPQGELARLVATAQAIKETLESLGIAIIGGKDSSSLATRVGGLLVKSLETVVLSSVAHVPDVNCYITPEIKSPGESVLILVDLASGKRRLGGSSLAQCYGQLGDDCPDLENPVLLKQAFGAVQELIKAKLITAGHDVSDGGILTAVAEMCFAAGCGCLLEFNGDRPLLNEYFAEELGYIIEASFYDAEQVEFFLAENGIPYVVLGQTDTERQLQVFSHDACVLNVATDNLRRQWERTGFELQKLRMNSNVARLERRYTKTLSRPEYRLSFMPPTTKTALESVVRHKVAVIREQGSNGHEEMIAAWTRVGFEVWDVHMNDLLSGRLDSLAMFRGVVFPGGFSYSDVLGAAVGWALKIQFNPKLKDIFDDFFAREDTFSFGVCKQQKFSHERYDH